MRGDFRRDSRASSPASDADRRHRALRRRGVSRKIFELLERLGRSCVDRCGQEATRFAGAWLARRAGRGRHESDTRASSGARVLQKQHIRARSSCGDEGCGSVLWASSRHPSSRCSRRPHDAAPPGRLPRPSEPALVDGCEPRGRVEAVMAETRDCVTLWLRPGRGWPAHVPGQYVRVGVDVDGVRHWRTYSLTSVPRREDGRIAITVKRIPGGLVSEHLVSHARRGHAGSARAADRGLRPSASRSSIRCCSSRPAAA